MVNSTEKMNLVLPGDILGTSEEFLPGRNVMDENGLLIALKPGTLVKDEKNLTVSVHSFKVTIKPKPGDVVYGQVTKSDRGKYNIAIGAFQEPGHKELIPTKMESTLKVESSRDEKFVPVRVGDYVRGKLFVSRYGTDISIGGREFGVLLAKCNNCRQMLFLENNSLKCHNCGNIESRKLAEDYGKIDLYGKKF